MTINWPRLIVAATIAREIDPELLRQFQVKAKMRLDVTAPGLASRVHTDAVIGGIALILGITINIVAKIKAASAILVFFGISLVLVALWCLVDLIRATRSREFRALKGLALYAGIMPQKTRPGSLADCLRLFGV